MDKRSEAPLQLVPIGHTAIDIACSWLGCGWQLGTGRPLPLAPGFGVADSDEQAIGPALVLGWVPEATDIAPDVEQRLLGGVLGQMEVT